MEYKEYKEGMGPIPGEGVGVCTFGHNDRTDPPANPSLHNGGLHSIGRG